MPNTEYTPDTHQILSQSQYCSAETRGELDGVRVEHPLFSAYLVLQGAQLLECTLKGEPLLWLSPEADYRRGQSVRGGIPVCWPWFGNADKNAPDVQAFIPDSSLAPAHGLVRQQDWQLTSVEESADAVCMRLSIEQSPAPHWRGNATLQLTITLTGSALTLALTTEAHSACTLTQALHTYFPTENIHHTAIVGLDQVAYTDAMDDWLEHQQQGELTFTQETDRIVHTGGPFSLKRPEGTLTLTSNSKSAIVWNPWIKKSQRLSQFPDDGWQTMFCVESANALHDVVKLNAGERHTLEMRISPES